MTWIKVHDTIRDNRKILLAADQLRIPEPAMIGHMVRLWLWGIENAPGGVLDVSDEMIARIAGFAKSGRAFVEALIQAGLLARRDDHGYSIVNYDEHIKPIIDAADRKRQNQAIARRQGVAGTGATTAHASHASERRGDPAIEIPT